VRVKKHTLFNYYQEWKREREGENERKRLAAEHQQRMEAERKEMGRKQEEETLAEGMADALRRQQQIQLEKNYENQKKIVWELEAQLSIAADKFNDGEVQRIGELYSKAYDEFRLLTRELYPQYADEKSIGAALRHKQD
jgi:hypothetical protein